MNQKKKKAAPEFYWGGFPNMIEKVRYFFLI